MELIQIGNALYLLRQNLGMLPYRYHGHQDAHKLTMNDLVVHVKEMNDILLAQQGHINFLLEEVQRLKAN